MATQKDLSTLPMVLTLKNAGTENVGFRYFRVNFVEVLEPEDEVIISAQSSEEAAYYLALADAEKGLEVAQGTSDDSSSDSTEA